MVRDFGNALGLESIASVGETLVLMSPNGESRRDVSGLEEGASEVLPLTTPLLLLPRQASCHC